MPDRDLDIVLKGTRLPDGVLELTFSRLAMGFTSWMCTVHKEAGIPVEDADFLRQPAIRAPWMYRFFMGLGDLSPVLRVVDRQGNSVWFYHGWDRRQRERIYCYARNGRIIDEYELLVDRESFAAMVTQLRAMTGETD